MESVNFSNSHDNYYSAWKYVTKEDEEVLQSADHPHLWNSKPPRTQSSPVKLGSDPQQIATKGFSTDYGSF